MKPVPFPGHNVVLRAPASCPDVLPLPVYRDESTPTGSVASCWELEPGDLEAIQRTGRVWLIVEGRTHPPLRLAAQALIETIVEVPAPAHSVQNPETRDFIG